MARKEKHDYFDAFQRQARLALKEAEMLIRTIDEFTTAEAVQDIMPDAHAIESEADEINHANFKAIAIDFITPIDRDDIMRISQALDEVVDEIEEVVQEFYIMNVHFMHHSARAMAELIYKSCQALVAATMEFPNFKKSPEFRKAVVEANDYEEEADRLYAQAIRNLHTHDEDNPMRVLVWSRIFTKMEICTDAAERVVDIMNSVVLKNS